MTSPDDAADADRSDPEGYDGSVWRRWPATGDNAGALMDETIPLGDVHVHRFCELDPRASEPDDAPRFQFTTGAVRRGLRHTPTVVLVLAVALVAYAEVAPDLQGLSALLPSVTLAHVAVLAGVGALWTGLVSLLGTVGVLDADDLAQAAVVYGLLAGLLAGVAGSAYLVFVGDAAAYATNVIFVSGYLLLLLLGGLLVYDGMLRTEHLLTGLLDRDVVADVDRYDAFLDDLADGMQARTVFGLRAAHVFAVLFVLQFAGVWLLGDGPQNLGSPLTFALNAVLDFFVVVVAFQFLVLVNYFHQLVTDTYDADAHDEPLLRYEPFHVDGHGGFRDLGRFATRVNLLLTVAGLYLVYRLYVQGVRVLPAAGLAGFADPLDLVVWLASYAGPVAAYAVAAGAWLYYSFWAMHVKMERDRERLSSRFHGRRGSESGQTPGVGDPIESFPSGPDWFYLRDAPVWPIDNRRLVGLVSGNVVPLLVPLANLLF